jgi:Protein of unknown function (DUF2934)
MPRSTPDKTTADEPRPKRTRRLVKPGSRRRTAAPAPVTHEQIALRAYELHLRGEGSDPMENWLKAERELVAA